MWALFSAFGFVVVCALILRMNYYCVFIYHGVGIVQCIWPESIEDLLALLLDEILTILVEGENMEDFLVMVSSR